MFVPNQLHAVITLPNTASTAIATVLGTLLGFGLNRFEFPGKRAFATLLYVPVFVPDIVLAVALIRGFARASANTVGNFWVDVTRCTLYVLLPISIVVGLFFVWQGMPQNLAAYTEATTLEGAKQLIAQGPVASQEVIKMLGTNGGGFFNANSAHPFENPNAATKIGRAHV